MAIAVIDRETLFAERGLTWKTETSGSVSAAASYRVGFVTPASEIVVLTRDYSSTVPDLLAALYAAPFSGGALARNLNLRLSYSGPKLMDISEGVTASLTGVSIITSAAIRAGAATGNANASLPGDLKPIILAPSTSYVVDLSTTAAAGTISLAFYYRPRMSLRTFNETP